jgi:hypothetical protein
MIHWHNNCYLKKVTDSVQLTKPQIETGACKIIPKFYWL